MQGGKLGWHRNFTPHESKFLNTTIPRNGELKILIPDWLIRRIKEIEFDFPSANVSYGELNPGIGRGAVPSTESRLWCGKESRKVWTGESERESRTWSANSAKNWRLFSNVNEIQFSRRVRDSYSFDSEGYWSKHIALVHFCTGRQPHNHFFLQLKTWTQEHCIALVRPIGSD